LGRRGIRIFGIARSSAPLGSRSRYIERLDAPHDELELTNYLVDFSKKLKARPVIFPMSDSYVLFLARNEKNLSDYYLFPKSDNGLTDKLVSKVGTVELLSQLQINYPKTVVLRRGSEQISSLDDMHFPCIIKPKYHDSWENSQAARKVIGGRKPVLLVENRSLLEEIAKILGPIDDFILQEYVPGPSSNFYYYVGYRSHDGRILAAYVGNKVRTFPDCLGSETLLRSVHVPELIECGNEILHRLNYHGPAGIDFKYDSCENVFKVIEINCRLGINDCYLAKSGPDIAHIYYLDSHKVRVVPHLEYPAGVTWYDFNADLNWMRMYRKREKINWASWIKELVIGYDNYALFSLNDVRPFLDSVSCLSFRLGKKQFPYSRIEE
jgi:predicted ATP-grasp superfamily ATP-dependent carboligase